MFGTLAVGGVELTCHVKCILHCYAIISRRGCVLLLLMQVSVVTNAPCSQCVSDVVNPSLTVYLEVNEGVNLRQTMGKLVEKMANLQKMVSRELLRLLQWICARGLYL